MTKTSAVTAETSAVLIDPESLSLEERQCVGRIVEAEAAITKGKELTKAGTVIRNRAINQLRTYGWTIAQLEEITGLGTTQLHTIGREAGVRSRRTATLVADDD